MKEKNTAHKQKNKFVEFLSLLWRTKKVAFFGMVVLIFFILVAIFADVLAPQKMENGMLASSLIDAGKAPSLQHPLGTDAMGVDMLSYMIYGARTSVILGITCTILSTVISVVIGVASAVIGGKFDLILQRFIDAWQCIPGMLIMLIMMTMLGSGMLPMIIVLSIPGGIGGSRMIRSASSAGSRSRLVARIRPVMRRVSSGVQPSCGRTSCALRAEASSWFAGSIA